MNLRYNKRLGRNKGFTLNFSNSGVSSSYRTKYGTIGSKSFSIKSGIPGLTFRSSYGRGKNKNGTILIILGIILSGFILYYSAVIIYNFALFLWWILTETHKLILRKYYMWRERNQDKVENST